MWYLAGEALREHPAHVTMALIASWRVVFLYGQSSECRCFGNMWAGSWSTSDVDDTSMSRMTTMLTTKQARMYVRARDGDMCWICGEHVDEGRMQGDPLQATVDHVVERCRGGEDHLGNLRLAHWDCNMMRTNYDIMLTPGLRRLLDVIAAMVEGTMKNP
jgi:5-methylcytosine-specific restriction endonuclease McrA